MLEIILHFHEREIKTKPTVTIKAEKIRKWNGLSLKIISPINEPNITDVSLKDETIPKWVVILT